jgi:hypothetical protein
MAGPWPHRHRRPPHGLGVCTTGHHQAHSRPSAQTTREFASRVQTGGKSTGRLAARWFGRAAGGRWTRARTTPLASVAPSGSPVAVIAQRRTSWYARSHRSCPSGCSLVSRRTSKVRRMPALPLLLSQLEGLHRSATAATRAAATSPAEAGRSGSSRTCHLRSNHRAHHPLRQTDPRLGDSSSSLSRAGRAVDLAGAGRLHPAAPGPRARGRSAAGVGAAPTARPAVALPGPQGVSRLRWVVGSPAAAPKPSGRSPGRPKGRRSGPALRHPAIKKPTKKPRKKRPTTTKAACRPNPPPRPPTPVDGRPPRPTG